MKNIEEKYLELNDIKVSYSECGEGPNLILIHGNSGNKKQFKRYQQKYFPMFHTYAIDSRGHGQSISIDREITIEQISNDIIKFCETLNITNPYIVGYSDGGNIALFLAKKAPMLFSKIIAISPNYLVSGMKDNSIKLIKRFYSIFLFMQKIGIDTKKQMMRFDLMLKDIGLSDNDLKNIHANIKFLYAENDMIKEEHIQAMRELIPNSMIKRIEKCNHLTILTRPETLIEIETFLR